MLDRTVCVLVVDDSSVARLFLKHLLESDPRIRVIGTVCDGQAALDFVRVAMPDVVLMDINMPGMDGFEATRRIMEKHPVPIVTCSASLDPDEVARTFRMLEAGAVACIEKPRGREHADHEVQVATLLQTVKLMSEVKVVRRWARSASTSGANLPAITSAPISLVPEFKHGRAGYRFVGIGTSTGGPPVLQTILSKLPKDFAVPILVVQHISRGFLPGLIEWLGQTSELQVRIGSHGTTPLPGHAYLAPDGMQMGLGAGGRILLTHEPAENGLRPAVSYLFRSLADNCGPDAVGVLLTGMGKDGAAELRKMRDRGAMTIAQDRDSSVVHGMPGEAIALGAACQILAADRIADTLVNIINNGRVKGDDQW